MFQKCCLDHSVIQYFFNRKCFVYMITLKAQMAMSGVSNLSLRSLRFPLFFSTSPRLTTDHFSGQPSRSRLISSSKSLLTHAPEKKPRTS